MSFPRYSKYKASGVEWLGDVPEHWEVVPFKHRCSRYALYGANMSSDEYVSNGVRFLRTTDISENGELEPDGVFISPEVAREYLLKDKDILISRSGTIGRAFVFAADVHPECAYAGYLVRFVPTKQLNSRLFFYFTKSVAFSDWLQTQLIFSTIGNVNGQKYAQCRLTLPPIPEQITIAAFLDHETAKIDELVAEQERLIELLKEKRQAVISHAVTKGLNPDAPMKDSGIEWLGEVPEHWDVVALKRHFQIVGGSTPKSDTESFWDGDILWATPSDLSKIDSLHLNDTQRKITSDGLASCATTMVPADSIILSTRAPIGSLAIAEIPMCTNQGCKSLVPSEHADAKFFARLLSISTTELNIRGKGTTFLELSSDELGAFKTPLPPTSEQITIAAFLDHETAKINILTTEANRVIDLLKERRTALISAAVTGQIDVRNLVPVESA